DSSRSRARSDQRPLRCASCDGPPSCLASDRSSERQWLCCHRELGYYYTEKARARLSVVRCRIGQVGGNLSLPAKSSPAAQSKRRPMRIDLIDIIPLQLPLKHALVESGGALSFLEHVATKVCTRTMVGTGLMVCTGLLINS